MSLPRYCFRPEVRQGLAAALEWWARENAGISFWENQKKNPYEIGSVSADFWDVGWEMGHQHGLRHRRDV
jgi:hypothetical protein